MADGQSLIFLESPINQAVLHGKMAKGLLQILCLDVDSHDNNPLKINTVNVTFSLT